MEKEKVLDEMCKFKIGEFLTAKAQLVAVGKSTIHAPQTIQVIERVVQQCYGGVQIHYDCRITVVSIGAGATTGAQLFRFTEPELESRVDTTK